MVKNENEWKEIRTRFWWLYVIMIKYELYTGMFS